MLLESFDTYRPQTIVRTNSSWNFIPLHVQVDIDLDSILCHTEHENLIVPALYPNQHGVNSAEEICNKMEKNSVLKHFESLEQWTKFHTKFKDLPAVVDQCWKGGRKLVWMPYHDKDTDFVFHHMLTGEPVYGANGAWMSGELGYL